MNDLKSRITEGGRIIIPAKLRKLFNLKIGEEIILRPMEDSILLVNKKQATKIIQSICKKHSGEDSLADELILERKKEKE